MRSIWKLISSLFARIKRWTKNPRAKLVFEYKFYYRPRSLAYFHGRQLERVHGNPPSKGSRRITAVVPYYGNRGILPSFLKHYRYLGVQQFVFLDLSEQRELIEILHADTDVAIWRPPAAQPVKHGLHWLNFLRQKYCIGCWCLSVEPSEFFIFYRCEVRHLRDFVEILENEHRGHVYAIVVEAYGDGRARDLDAEKGSPFDLLPYFDGVGYTTREGGRFRSVVTQGGVQRRTLFGDDPRRSPPLNRIPFMRWGPRCYYLANTRVVVPHRFNSAHAKWHLSPTSCLLRYSLLDDEKVLAIAGNVEEASLLTDGLSPTYPGAHIMRGQVLKHYGSVRYGTSQDLVAWGLLSPGQWF